MEHKIVSGYFVAKSCFDFSFKKKNYLCAMEKKFGMQMIWSRFWDTIGGATAWRNAKKNFITTTRMKNIFLWSNFWFSKEKSCFWAEKNPTAPTPTETPRFPHANLLDLWLFCTRACRRNRSARVWNRSVARAFEPRNGRSQKKGFYGA